MRPPAIWVSLAIASTSLFLAGCNHDPAPDRRQSPGMAFEAARAALRRHDLASYFDALSDEAVRKTLTNSVGICLASSDPAFRANLEKYGQALSPATGCGAILLKFGWKEPPERSDPRAWERAVEAVSNPREMAAELEANLRTAGTGTSFVWEYLDRVKLSKVVVQGDSATATVDWSGEAQPVAFVRDSSGWRFTPFPQPP